MTSFDLNNVNNLVSQTVQPIGYTKNIPMIRDKIDLPVQKDTSYISEGQMATILREKGIDASRKRMEIAMALYYQNQAIHEDNIKYMEQMAEILKLNSQEAYEAYILLVTNSLEVTDERISAVKEIITNKNFVSDLKELKNTIEELDQIIVQGVEEKVFVQTQDVEKLIDTTISTTQENNNYQTNIDTTKVLVVQENIEQDFNNTIVEKEVLIQDKTQDNLTQKSIDNNFSTIAQDIKISEDINDTIQENIVIDNKVNNIKTNQETIKPQENILINNDTKQKQNLASEKLVTEQYTPKDLSSYNIDLKKISQQITTILNLKKEIFHTSTNTNSSTNTSSSEYIGAAKFSQPDNFFDGIETFEGGLRNFGMSDDAKSLYQKSNNQQDENIVFKTNNDEAYIEVKSDSGVTKNYRVYSDVNNLKNNVPYLVLINGIPKLIEKNKTDIKILQVNLNITDDILNMMSPKQVKTVIIDGKPNLFIIEKGNEKPLILDNQNLRSQEINSNKFLEGKPVSINSELKPSSKEFVGNQSLKLKDVIDTNKISLSQSSDFKVIETTNNIANTSNNIIFTNKPVYEIKVIDNKSYLVISDSEQKPLSLNNIISDNKLKDSESGIKNNNKLFVEIPKNIDDLINSNTVLNILDKDTNSNNVLDISVKDGISYLVVRDNNAKVINIPITDILSKIDIPEIRLDNLLENTNSENLNIISKEKSDNKTLLMDNQKPELGVNPTNNDIKSNIKIEFNKPLILNLDTSITESIINTDSPVSESILPKGINPLDNKSLEVNSIINSDLKSSPKELVVNQSLDNQGIVNNNKLSLDGNDNVLASDNKVIKKSDNLSNIDKKQVFNLSNTLNTYSKIIVRTESGLKVFDLSSEIKQEIKSNNISNIVINTDNAETSKTNTISPIIEDNQLNNQIPILERNQEKILNKSTDSISSKENINQEQIKQSNLVIKQDSISPFINKISFVNDENQIVVIPENILNSSLIDITSSFFNIEPKVNNLFETQQNTTNNIEQLNSKSRQENSIIINSNPMSSPKELNINQNLEAKSIINPNKFIQIDGQEYFISDNEFIKSNNLNESSINDTKDVKQNKINLNYIDNKPVIEVKLSANNKIIVPIVDNVLNLDNLISSEKPLILNLDSNLNNIVSADSPISGSVLAEDTKPVDNKLSLDGNKNVLSSDNKVIQKDYNLSNIDTNIDKKQVFNLSNTLNTNSKIIVRTESGLKVFDLSPEIKQEIKSNNISNIVINTDNAETSKTNTISPIIEDNQLNNQIPILERNQEKILNKSTDSISSKENINQGQIKQSNLVIKQDSISPFINKISFVNDKNQIVVIPENILNSSLIDITSSFFNIEPKVNNLSETQQNTTNNIEQLSNKTTQNTSSQLINNANLDNNVINTLENVNSEPLSVVTNINNETIENSIVNTSNLNNNQSLNTKESINTPIIPNKFINIDGKNYLIVLANNNLNNTISNNFSLDTSELNNNQINNVFALPVENIEKTPNLINQIKKEVFNSEYSQVKQNLNKTIDNTLDKVNNIPAIINNMPVIISKPQQSSTSNLSIVPLKDGNEIPQYLEASIGKENFIFIRLEDNKNIFIPKLKVENSIFKDINNLLEIKPQIISKNNVLNPNLSNSQNIPQIQESEMQEDNSLFVKDLDGNNYIVPKTRQDIINIPTKQPLVIAYDKSNQPVLITNNISLEEHIIISDNEVLDNKNLNQLKNNSNRESKVSHNQNNIGFIDLNNKNNISQGLKVENFVKPMVINISKSENQINKQLIISDNSELYSFNIDNKTENLVQNNEINKSFNKSNISVFNNEIISKQDNKIFKTDITPNLLKNAEPINNGFNLTKENGVIIVNNQELKELNIDEIPENLSLDEPIFFKSNSSNQNIFNSISNTSNLTKNITNNTNKDFILLKNPEDSTLRLINQDNISDFGQENDFSEPLLINSADKKGLVFKSPNNSELKFISNNNLLQNSEKILSSGIFKVNNQDNLIIPTKDGAKIFNISNNLDKNDIINDKLKVKIEGKNFFIIPENKTGEHIILPENPLNKTKIDISSPIKVQIDKENFVLVKNNQTNNLHLISENKANKLSQNLQSPISAKVNDSESVITIIDKKAYKLPLNNKVIESSKNINEPIQIDNLKFVLFDKNNKPSVLNLDSKQLFKADKITGNVIVNNSSGEFLILANNKNSKVVSSENIDKISKFSTEIKSNNIVLNNDKGLFILNKNHIENNKQEVNEPILLSKDNKEFILLPNKKNSGFISKDNIIKNSNIIDNAFIPDKNNSNFIFKDKSGLIKNINIPNNIIKNPEKINDIFQTKIDNKNIVINSTKESINIINLKPEDKIDNSKNYKVSIQDKNYNLVFNNDKPILLNEKALSTIKNYDFNKPFKVSIDNSEYIIFKSPEDNKIKILPTKDIKLDNAQNFDIESINEFDVSEFIDVSFEKDNLNNLAGATLDNKVVSQSNNKDYKIALSISDGELVLRKVTKQNQNDINIENIKNIPIEELNDTNIDGQEIANNSVLINQVASSIPKPIREIDKSLNEILDENIEVNDSQDSISTISNKSTKTDLSKYDVKISFDSLINSVLSGKNNDKSAIESIKGLNLFLHKDDELIETDEENKEPLVFNIKEQKKEKFIPQERFTLAQNTSGKESLIVKSANNSLKAINIDIKAFSELEQPIIDENGDIILPDKDSKSIFKINQSSINNIVTKNINQNVFINANNLITRKENTFIETPINNVKNNEIDENTPFIAKVDGKESILINHKGNLKQIPINYLSSNIEKIKENTVFVQDNNKILYFKDDKSNIVLNIDKNIKFKDVSTINNIKIDDISYNLKNNKLIIDDNKANIKTNLKEINLSKPIKVDTNIGSGILFIEPITNKVRFIDNKDLSKNNLLKNNESVNISPTNYIIPRKNDLVKVKIQENTLNKAIDLDSPKEIEVNNKEQYIVPNKIINRNNEKENKSIEGNTISISSDSKTKVNTNKHLVFNKQDILDNSKIINKPFYVNHEDEKYLFIDSKNGFKTIKTNDLSNKLQKIEQPIIFEKNNNIHIIKDDLSAVTFDKSIIDEEEIFNNLNEGNLDTINESFNNNVPKNLENKSIINNNLKTNNKENIFNNLDKQNSRINNNINAKSIENIDNINDNVTNTVKNDKKTNLINTRLSSDNNTISPSNKEVKHTWILKI
ncbi:MAG: hypothetical protein U0354_09180 [Candidatus Sericytochromatia bacterium]